MRAEAEMLALIVGLAAEQEGIRAVVLDGSRTNPNAPRDIFQDYDVTYLVTSLDAWVFDRSWLRPFGRTIIMQTPDEMELPEPGDGTRGFTFLMLFEDGNRIDLNLHPCRLLTELVLDEWSRVLLDKDGNLAQLPRVRSPYRNIPPTAKRFADCCNEFWWVGTYVAKGLWRAELPYAKATQDDAVRPMLDQMLAWRIGLRSGFDVEVGKHGKYFERRLSAAEWSAYRRTYSAGDRDDVWRSLFLMCDLFRDAALDVARRMGFSYAEDEDASVRAHLRHVHDLPRDAAGVY